jgi:hypothetical protein
MQHYVPRFYLAKFSSRSNGSLITNCFDKVSGNAFRANIRHIAGEKYFYDSSRGTNQDVEKRLGTFEAAFNRAYARVIEARDLTKLSSNERRSMAYFLVVQELRTREYRQLLKDMTTQTKNRLLRDNVSPKLRRDLESMVTDASVQSMQLGMISDAPTFSGIVQEMMWSLLENRTSLPFWTSDHPINRWNDMDLSPFGNLGLLSPGIQLYFPLSPDLALMVTDPKIYGFLPDKIEMGDRENVAFQNRMQVGFSTRHVFSAESDFSVARDFLKKRPDLANINRRRIEVI